MTTIACGFLKPDPENPEALVRCDDAAVCVARCSEIGTDVPACESCAAGRQIKRPMVTP